MTRMSYPRENCSLAPAIGIALIEVRRNVNSPLTGDDGGKMPAAWGVSFRSSFLRLKDYRTTHLDTDFKALRHFAGVRILRAVHPREMISLRTHYRVQVLTVMISAAHALGELAPVGSK